MHNCKTAHPEKSHRRRNRTLRRALAPLHFPDGWGSSEPGPAPKRVTSGDRVQAYPASMLRRLATVVTRLFVRKTPGR